MSQISNSLVNKKEDKNHNLEMDDTKKENLQTDQPTPPDKFPKISKALKFLHTNIQPIFHFIIHHFTLIISTYSTFVLIIFPDTNINLPLKLAIYIFIMYLTYILIFNFSEIEKLTLIRNFNADTKEGLIKITEDMTRKSCSNHQKFGGSVCYSYNSSSYASKVLNSLSECRNRMIDKNKNHKGIKSLNLNSNLSLNNENNENEKLIDISQTGSNLNFDINLKDNTNENIKIDSSSSNSFDKEEKEDLESSLNLDYALDEISISSDTHPQLKGCETLFKGIRSSLLYKDYSFKNIIDYHKSLLILLMFMILCFKIPLIIYNQYLNLQLSFYSNTKDGNNFDYFYTFGLTLITCLFIYASIIRIYRTMFYSLEMYKYERIIIYFNKKFIILFYCVLISVFIKKNLISNIDIENTRIIDINPKFSCNNDSHYNESDFKDTEKMLYFYIDDIFKGVFIPFKCIFILPIKHIILFFYRIILEHSFLRKISDKLYLFLLDLNDHKYLKLIPIECSRIIYWIPETVKIMFKNANSIFKQIFKFILEENTFLYHSNQDKEHLNKFFNDVSIQPFLQNIFYFLDNIILDALSMLLHLSSFFIIVYLSCLISKSYIFKKIMKEKIVNKIKIVKTSDDKEFMDVSMIKTLKDIIKSYFYTYLGIKIVTSIVIISLKGYIIEYKDREGFFEVLLVLKIFKMRNDICVGSKALVKLCINTVKKISKKIENFRKKYFYEEKLKETKTNDDKKTKNDNTNTKEYNKNLYHNNNKENMSNTYTLLKLKEDNRKYMKSSLYNLESNENEYKKNEKEKRSKSGKRLSVFLFISTFIIVILYVFINTSVFLGSQMEKFHRIAEKEIFYIQENLNNDIEPKNDPNEKKYENKKDVKNKKRKNIKENNNKSIKEEDNIERENRNNKEDNENEESINKSPTEEKEEKRNYTYVLYYTCKEVTEKTEKKDKEKVQSNKKSFNLMKNKEEILPNSIFYRKCSYKFLLIGMVTTLSILSIIISILRKNIKLKIFDFIKKIELLFIFTFLSIIILNTVLLSVDTVKVLNIFEYIEVVGKLLVLIFISFEFKREPTKNSHLKSSRKKNKVKKGGIKQILSRLFNVTKNIAISGMVPIILGNFRYCLWMYIINIFFIVFLILEEFSKKETVRNSNWNRSLRRW